MLVSNPGFVLQNIKYGDTSLIIKILTLDHGLISLIAKGILASRRSAMSAGHFQLLNQVQVGFNMHPNKTLFTLRDVKLLHSTWLQPIASPSVLAVSSFMAEVSLKTLPDQVPSPTFYHILASSIQALSNSDSLNDLPVSFLMDWLEAMGIAPQEPSSPESIFFSLSDGGFTHLWSADCLTLQDSQHLAAYFTQGLQHFKQVHRLQLLRILIHYLQFHAHLTHSFQSLDTFQSIWARP